MKQDINNKVIGLVERVTFHDSENGFCVIKIKVYGKKDLVTVVGNIPSILAGEQVECIGQWVMDKEHGLQFKSETLKSTPPTSLEGIERYLASGLIKGIGPVYAKKLISSFGEDVFNVIEEESHRLKEVGGIGDSRAKIIVESWKLQKSIRTIILFLHSHNISTAKATRIYREYGDNAISIVEQNPYRLANDIKGIGFKSADKIAESLGIEKNSIIRARAGINHALATAMDNGNCGLPTSKLIKLAQELLEIPQSLIEDALKLEITDKNVVVETIDNEECIFLKGLATFEQQIAQTLVILSRGQLKWKRIDSEEATKEVIEQTGVQLSKSQQEAIKWVLCSGFSVVTGGPGVGKTTLINSILKILKTRGIKVLLSAPTGRAAKRLSEATGYEAVTIHRLLKRNPDQEFNKNVEVDCQLLIVDEASMLDVSLMHGILKALSGRAALLLVGDIDQLPSVGAGQVLSDIIQSGGVTVAALTEVFRQTQQSSIITNAHRINRGLTPILPSKKEENQDSGVDDTNQNQENNNLLNDFFFIESESPEHTLAQITSLVSTRLPKKFGTSPFTDIQVLSPMTRGIVGTRNLNTELQRVLVPYSSSDNEVEAFGNCFRVKDKVMQTVNDYDKDVYNGDIGTIVAIDKENQEVIINFDNRKVNYEYSELDEIVHAYATTIHKSQGSEYHTVVIPLMMQHYLMLQRNLIYTAVTRAKKLVIIVGERKALNIAISRASASSRYSTLKKRLLELTQWY